MSLIRDVRLRQDDFDLSIDHLEISDSGITLLWGPSGSGKSTFLRVLMGLEYVASMTWLRRGVDINKLSVEKRNLGVVFQNLELFPHMTGRMNIEFAARARGLERSTYQKKINELCELFQMEFLDKSVLKLSGGQRQRIALARAIIGNPEMLILDEPFSALDQSLKEEGRQMVQLLAEKFLLPILMVSHEVEDREQLAHHIIEMNDGRVVKSWSKS